MTINAKLPIIALLSSILIWACKKDKTTTTLPSGTTFIEPSTQRTGNAEVGKAYLIGGSYVSSGIPYDVFKLAFGTSTEDLGRTGDNKGVAYNFLATTASNGVKVVTGNCLSCHADHSPADGSLVVGLGSTTADNTQDLAQQFGLIDNVVKARYGGTNSSEWKAYYPLSRGFTTLSPFIKMTTRGVNNADQIAAVLSAYRHGKNLTWLDQAQFPIAQGAIPTDVPAWWLTHKKNALYYDGLGRGDFARLSMATSLLTMLDSTEARKIDNKFPDVMAYIRSLRPPQYPNPIDQNLVSKGKAVFEISCAKCHGTYGTTPTYPNLLVDLPTIKTDSALANAKFSNPQYHTWFNTSWFNQGAGAAQLVPSHGYVAPPLDGIWATAPYLHNGSVPTLDDLLNSKQRPAKWSRTFDNKADYDAVKVGWKYLVQSTKVDNKTYDIMQYGYGNGGHTFGDALTVDERKAVIEYLKTL